MLRGDDVHVDLEVDKVVEVDNVVDVVEVVEVIRVVEHCVRHCGKLVNVFK